MGNARLLIDPPASGSWNMAVDQTLLESVGKTGEIVLRFYRWEEPTLSLGYFQALQERNSHQASLECPAVRRSTGGGAILHDQELTYSLCVPSRNRWAEKHEQLYRTVHGCIIEALADWGVDSELYDEAANQLQSVLSDPLTDLRGSGTGVNVKPFLCFKRRSKGDVIWRGEKICGSAQRRDRSSILQHGSLIFGRSPFAPEIPGIDDLSTRSPLVQDSFLTRLIRRFEEVLRLDLVESKLEVLESLKASQLAPKFCSPNWLNRRRWEKDQTAGQS